MLKDNEEEKEKERETNSDVILLNVKRDDITNENTKLQVAKVKK